jgi:NDP-sugar pyrophosphorylase family protein
MSDDFYPAFLKSVMDAYDPVWNILDDIADIIARAAREAYFTRLDGDVFIGKNVSLAQNAVIIGPALIGAGCEIRPGAYLRGNVILGENTVVGNSTEVKNSVLLNNVQAMHFNYIGDSILGNYVHLGAGVILSNFRLDQKPVYGRVKLGSVIGDHVEVGANSVLNPGTILGPKTVVYPLSHVKGTHKAGTVLKTPFAAES